MEEEKQKEEGEEEKPLISLFASFQDYLSNDQEIREVRFTRSIMPLGRLRTYPPNQLQIELFISRTRASVEFSRSSLRSEVKMKNGLFFFSFDSATNLMIPWTCINLARRVLSISLERPAIPKRRSFRLQTACRLQTVQCGDCADWVLFYLFLFLHLLLSCICFGSGHKLVFNYISGCLLMYKLH